MPKKLLAISFLFFLLLSCVDEIDFETNKGEIDRLVIDGRIVELIEEDLNYAEVNVQKVFNFESSSRSTVSVEEVSITNGVQTLELTQTGLGTYGLRFTNQEYDLNQGLEHALYVKTLDGREYESMKVSKSTVSIPSELAVEIVPSTVIDSLGLTSIENQAVLSISSPLIPTENNALLWEATQTFQVSTTQNRKCYVTEQIVTDKIMLLDTRDLNLQQAEDILLFNTPVSKKFREGIYFSIRQFSLDQAITTNLRNINSLLSQTNTIFNDPLHKLQSNINNVADPEEDVFGFFYVSQAIDIRVKVDSVRTYCARTAAQGGTDLEADCPLDPRTFRPANGSDPLCCDCRTVPGVMTEKPEWWR